MELKLEKTELQTLSMDLTSLPAELTPMVAGGFGGIGGGGSGQVCGNGSEGWGCPSGGATTCVVDC